MRAGVDIFVERTFLALSLELFALDVCVRALVDPRAPRCLCGAGTAVSHSCIVVLCVFPCRLAARTPPRRIRHAQARAITNRAAIRSCGIRLNCRTKRVRGLAHVPSTFFAHSSGESPFSLSASFELKPSSRASFLFYFIYFFLLDSTLATSVAAFMHFARLVYGDVSAFSIEAAHNLLHDAGYDVARAQRRLLQPMFAATAGTAEADADSLAAAIEQRRVDLVAEAARVRAEDDAECAAFAVRVRARLDAAASATSSSSPSLSAPLSFVELQSLITEAALRAWEGSDAALELRSLQARASRCSGTRFQRNIWQWWSLC